MDDQPNDNNNSNNRNTRDKSKKKVRDLSSTTSLGKRRTFADKTRGQSARSPRANNQEQAANDQYQQATNQNQPTPKHQHHHHHHHHHHHTRGASPQPAPGSTMSEPRTSEYGSQATLMRVPIRKVEDKLTKVTILGASGGIGQPLGLLLMLHSEYIQHLALYDLAHVRGVGADMSHIDRQCKVTTHLGPDELPEAVRDASVIVILAGIAQKPGMSRDDLFGTNAKIMFDLARVCAQNAPDAFLAIVSNPVNSLVPLVNLVYQRYLGTNNQQQQQQALNVEKSHKSFRSQSPSTVSGKASAQRDLSPKGSAGLSDQNINANTKYSSPNESDSSQELPPWCRRIFGVTTLDVVRASTLVAKSPFFTPTSEAAPSQGAASILFKDPSKISVPVVGGHAGKTILPLLSQCTPKIDEKKLTKDMKATNKLIESIQEAGIEVLNAKRGAGSATLAMAYSACRFTIALLRAQLDEPNITECAYVRLPAPISDNLEYFSLPLQLGKHGYIRASSPLNKILPYEQQQVDEAVKLLRANVARGEDFAKEQLSVDKS